MLLSVEIYKEKKEENFRMVILPTGRNKIGLRKIKDYGTISYLNKKDSKKIGELILWALNECDEEIIENETNIKWGKQYFNLNSNTKVVSEYNKIGFEHYDNKYELSLSMKDGYGYSPFKDKEGNECKCIFKEKPSAEELGKKVMEMFEFKENYDNSNK
ncbi:MAG: osmolarity sensor protein EnvZ [Fusobacterium sp.]|uniref:osmolarity sensor protein EnvZ n=1 Tax=Fusobacterium sp. TaxID=68766 RepID=UPI0026DBF3DC|nr:osmolarity sensor protein EnvZ [Fusobacterium sp.]MDO4690215.1 osmolarity sensor protein EnvZ [Fusobacterium sp.]